MTNLAPPTTGRIAFDPTQCRTCRVCETACSIAHFGVASPALAAINIAYDEFAVEDPIQGTICYHCADAPCIEACPVEALYRNPETGAVLVSYDLCIGCMRCLRACPYEVPKRHPTERKMIKCDLCADRPGGPACLEMCPLAGKALRYVGPENGDTP